MNAALLVNLLGFLVGIALYALLAAMVLTHSGSKGKGKINVLLLTTSALGLIWNLGEFSGFALRDFGVAEVSPFLIAASFSALGFLPSVVVHSAQAETGKVGWLTYAAYGLSLAASVLHFYAAATTGIIPSEISLQTLTIGSLALIVGLLLFELKQTLEKKAVWATALLVFSVSALHLSGGREGNSWLIELVAHQSSLPLALVILYQNYRFAFADLFLKRAISLLLLATVAAALYIFVAVPLLRYHETHDRDDVQAAALIVGLWIATALIYPSIYSAANWFVNKVLLQRPDYEALQNSLIRRIERSGTADEVLHAVRIDLTSALTARSSKILEEPAAFTPESEIIDVTADSVRLLIPTGEKPYFAIELREMFGGRRLLSDEIKMIETVSLIAARRIDALRVSDERFEARFREKEFEKLAAEAQLSALRSQINPHFLFNALTTIGYLITSSPQKAYDTLIKLTKLLRVVLRSSGEFVTLAAELELVENYLEIEIARFEERLSVKIDVPDELRRVEIPSLILQPLVENSIKHAISENKSGGTIRISAEPMKKDNRQGVRLVVQDSGSGKMLRSDINSDGVGLRNIRERLVAHYGDTAELTLRADESGGTQATVFIPSAVLSKTGKIDE